MLVITGMGRSGTSVLAALCQRLGFDPGGDYHKVINAGLEDPEVVAINEAILRRDIPVGSGTLQLVPAVRREVVKDPRFVLAGGTALRVWWEQRQDLRVVLTTRDPDEVVRSRRSHPDWFGAAADVTARALEEDAATTVGLMTALGIPFRVLRFPDFLARPGEVFDALRFGGLHFTDEAAHRQWRRQVDYAKVRHSPGWQGPSAPNGLRRLLGLLAR